MWSTALAGALLTGAACKDEPVNKVETTQKNVVDEQRDVDKQQSELAQAKIDLAKARSEYSLAIRERLSRVDARIAQLAAKTDTKSRESLAGLQEKRNAAAAMLERAVERNESNWETFKAEVNRGVDNLERDVDDAVL